MPTTRPFAISSRVASISSFSANGSPTWTEGRLDGSWSPNVAEASTDAPPMPSRPVADPYRTTRLPTPSAAARVSIPSSSSPIAITLTSGLPWYDGSNTSSPPTVGTPTQLPYPPTPRTTPSTRWRVRASDGSPNRRASRTAIGRAPIANTSRRIPPTPVAAPWYGSTADGWLWDSILNATASPSPIEITPACSPTPATTSRPAVGSVASSGRELLYEQCSLHMTLNMASSRSFGSRPSFSRMASSSTSSSPSARCSGAAAVAVTPGAPARARPLDARDRPGRRPLGRAHDERADDAQAVVGAEDRLGRRLRVGHEARDVARGVADAGDPAQRAVRVARVVGTGDRAVGVRVAPQHAAVALQRVERRVVGVVAALAVRDRHPQRRARRARA